MSNANILRYMDTIPQPDTDSVDAETRKQEAARLKAIYLRAKAERPDLKQDVLAEMCGWSSQGTVSQYMNGRMALNVDALSRFSRALKFWPSEVSPRLAEQIYGFEPNALANLKHKIEENVSPAYDTGRLLPLIGSVQAGSFCEAIDNYAPGDGEEMVHSGGPVGPRAFVLRVDGISMIPDFYPGDMAVVDPDLEAGQGHFVVAKRVSDQGVTLKKLRFEGGEAYLIASNEAWPERIIRLTEEWHICGRVRRKIVEM